MIVEIFGKVDLSSQRGMDALHAAVKNGLGFRPIGRGKTVIADPVQRKHGLRRRRNRRLIYKIDDDLGARMRRMRQDGATIRAIAKACRLSSSGVGNYLKRTEPAGGQG